VSSDTDADSSIDASDADVDADRDEVATLAEDNMTRVVTCDLAFDVNDRAEIAVQIVVAESAGQVVTERFDVATNGQPPASLEEVRNPNGERIHVIVADPGRLTIAYRAEILALLPQTLASAVGRGSEFPGASAGYERQLYLRPSRYCPSDHLVGFAVAEFGTGPDIASRVARITEWIRARISYVPGSSDVHDSAEHTLLTGMGTCRDFAHLGVALCRATGIPARFASVYAPGLSPMDFHAVFETLEGGHWYVHDATGLAPRPSLVRISTGRDAADTAFASVDSGVADLETLEVSATVGAAALPQDDHSQIVELA
jgi:transglutaminase-like putative cysteine protease